jgi:hypothetical protein
MRSTGWWHIPQLLLALGWWSVALAQVRGLRYPALHSRHQCLLDQNPRNEAEEEEMVGRDAGWGVGTGDRPRWRQPRARHWGEVCVQGGWVCSGNRGRQGGVEYWGVRGRENQKTNSSMTMEKAKVWKRCLQKCALRHLRALLSCVSKGHRWSEAGWVPLLASLCFSLR